MFVYIDNSLTRNVVYELEFNKSFKVFKTKLYLIRLFIYLLETFGLFIRLVNLLI